MNVFGFVVGIQQIIYSINSHLHAIITVSVIQNIVDSQKLL